MDSSQEKPKKDTIYFIDTACFHVQMPLSNGIIRNISDPYDDPRDHCRFEQHAQEKK